MSNGGSAMAVVVGVLAVSSFLLDDLHSDSNTRAAEILSADSPNQTEAAALLLDASLSPENFVGIVKKNGGTGKVMETLSLMASSPGVVGARFEELLEAVESFPDSEAAEYLANNRYLTDKQIRKIGSVLERNIDSRLALAFVKSGAAEGEDLDRLVNLVVAGKGDVVAGAVAGANGLSEDSQKKLLFVVVGNSDSELAKAFARNPFLNDTTMDSLGAGAVQTPVGALAEGFASNPGMTEGQMAALTQVAIEIPDSCVAAGLGANRAIKPAVFSELEKTVEGNPYSRLGVAMAGNPNLPDSIFAILSKAVGKDNVGSMAAALSSKGGAASNEVRAAELANLIIGDPNLPGCEALVDNPAVPPAHLSALFEVATKNPSSELSQAFIEQIREKRFRGGRREKMQILEAALMSGDVDSINTR